MCRFCGPKPLISPNASSGIPVANYRYEGNGVYSSVCKVHDIQQSQPLKVKFNDKLLDESLNVFRRYAKVNKLGTPSNNHGMYITTKHVKQVLESTGNRCAVCRATTGLKPALKVNQRDGGTFVPENLTVLCDQCMLHHATMDIHTVAREYWFDADLLPTPDDEKIIYRVEYQTIAGSAFYTLRHYNGDVTNINTSPSAFQALTVSDGIIIKSSIHDDFNNDDVNFEVVRYWMTKQGYLVVNHLSKRGSI